AQVRPHIVIHLAAVVGGIGDNQANPGKFYYDNLIMGAQLIEHARRTGVEKFVGLGTICAYPKFTPAPFRETALWDGYPEETNAPYGIAKKAMLVQLQAYRQQYNFPGIFLLPVNLYGPGDNFDLETSHVIPAMIRKFHQARADGRREVVLWGSGTATREFLYVDDCARAIVAATARYEGGEPVNIGSGEEIAIRDLAALIAGLMGYGGEIVWDRSRPDGQPRRCLDVTRAELEFGFRADTPLTAGLRATIAWWEAHCQASAAPLTAG
ncbi:MAG: GDP-L-fucose synthase family protein, partial [Candidatus Saccharimonadales bacterium]